MLISRELGIMVIMVRNLEEFYMFCPKCGKEINSKSRFCMNCGCDINEYGVEKSVEAGTINAASANESLDRPQQSPIGQPVSEQYVSAVEEEKKRRERAAAQAITKYKSEETVGKLIKKRKRKARRSFFAIILILVLIGFGVYAFTQDYTPKQMKEFIKCKAERLIYYNKPEGAVASYIDAIKSMDMEAMDKYSANPNQNAFGDENEEYNKAFFSYICELNKDICYKLVDSKIEGNKAEVRVTFEYRDASDFITGVLQEYFEEMVKRLVSLEGTSQEDMSNLLLDILNEKIETSNAKITTRTITVYCEKRDNKWYISEDNQGLLDVETANMYSVISSMVDAYTSLMEE